MPSFQDCNTRMTIPGVSRRSSAINRMLCTAMPPTSTPKARKGTRNTAMIAAP